MATIYFCVGCGKPLNDRQLCRDCHTRADRRGVKTCPVCDLKGVRHRHANTWRPVEEVFTCGWCGNTITRAIRKCKAHERGTEVPHYGDTPLYIRVPRLGISDMVAVGVRSRDRVGGILERVARRQGVAI